MKTLILFASLLTLNVFAQNEHLTRIRYENLNYTKEEIKNCYLPFDEIKLIKETNDQLIYLGGEYVGIWPLYQTLYHFNEDSLYEVDILFADTTESNKLALEILKTFRSLYGDEDSYNETPEGDEFWYWYFGGDKSNPDSFMFICKNANEKLSTLVTQANVFRLKKLEIK